MWNNIIEPERPQKTMWRMRIARWLRNDKGTLRIYNTYCLSNCCTNAPQF